MGKMKDALVKLAKKITGKEVQDENSISNVVNFMADNYQGGSGATYTAGNGIAITEENVINADVKVIETSNITGLTTEQCEALNVGDVVVKLTSNQKHTYTVSYKEAGVGMCLTYVDASTSETVSYDYTGGQWVYNSTDITPLKNIIANPELAGTEANLTGLQVGETKYAVPQGGSTKYLHSIYGLANFECNPGIAMFTFFSNNSTPITLEQLFNYLNTNRDVIISTYVLDGSNLVTTEIVLGYDENLETVIWGDRTINDMVGFVDIVSLNLDI